MWVDTVAVVTENGWPPDTKRFPNVAIPLTSCVQVTIPGTDGLKMWFQKGIPAIVLAAFMADLNQFVESAKNARGYTDEGSWTPSNSVATSNHLGATAFDYNWSDHPMGNALAGWGGSDIIPGPQEPEIRRLLAFYTFEGTPMVFWGNDWNSPKDSMHFQMGYGTFEDQDKCWRFINSRIREDGFSTYRRGGVPRGGGAAVPPVSGGLTPAVLAAVMDNRVSMERYEQLHPHFMDALDLAECHTPERRQMFIAQVGHESGGLRYQQEIASGSAYEGRADLGNVHPGDGVRYKGRDFIQITGRFNYTKLSEWAFGIGQVPTRTYFVDNPTELANDAYAFLGVVWYWTVARNMNSYADARDLEGATRAVNGGLNGLADRRAFYDRARAAGDDLLDPEPTDPWEALMASTEPDQSRSIYRTDNAKIFTPRDMVYNVDAMCHAQLVESAALRGEPWGIETVARLAAGQSAGSKTWYNPQLPDTWAITRARYIMTVIEATNPAALQAYLGKA